MHTNFKNIIDPRSNIGQLIESFPRADIVNFELSYRFSIFKQIFIADLQNFLEINKFNNYAVRKILNRYSADSFFISIKEAGKQVNFYWPNREFKSFTVFDKAIVTNDIFWLESYPFLEVDKENYKARLASNFEKLTDRYQINKELTCPSHNNHFGHFIFDDLPRCYLDKINLNPSTPHLSGTPINKGIREMLNQINYFNDIRELNVPQMHCQKNYILSSFKLHQSFISNPIINIYILYSIFDKLKKNNALQKELSNQKYFLFRGGSYKSRISNFSEIKKYLISKGFELIDPASISNISLLSKLNSAKQIVCESGSTTLVASLFSPRNCEIVALMPEEMIFNPDNNMIESGLPYHLICPSRMRIALGISLNNALIQSSNTCHYSIENIKQMVQ